MKYWFRSDLFLEGAAGEHLVIALSTPYIKSSIYISTGRQVIVRTDHKILSFLYECRLL